MFVGCVCVCVFTVSICADSASSEPVVAQGTSHVKVCSPGEVRCALIHVGSRGRQTKTSTSAGSKSLTGAFPCLLGVCMCVYCFNSVQIQQAESQLSLEVRLM